MTAFCSGHPAQAKAGFGAFVYMGPAALGAMLNNIPVAWAVPLAAYLGAITYDLATFCTGEPPTMPTITAADVFNLIAIENPVGHAAAVAKFTDLIGAYAWNSFCECTVVATPAAPAAPAAPTGLPNINPTLPGVPVPSRPCATFQSDQRSISSSTATSILGPFLAPPGATGFLVTIDHVSGGSSGLTSYEPQWTSTPVFSGAAAFGGAYGGGTAYHSTNFISGASVGRPYGWLTMRVASGTVVGSMRLEYFCGGASPTSPIANCDCPPDPVLSAQLQQILDLVRLIQRQGVPFAYVPGAAHTGLSGNGSLSVQGLLGVQVDITTLPTSYGREAGTPEELFDLGFVTFGTADGHRSSHRIEHDQQLVVPAAAGLYTTLGYTLRPGVVVTVLELLREP